MTLLILVLNIATMLIVELHNGIVVIHRVNYMAFHNAAVKMGPLLYNCIKDVHYSHRGCPQLLHRSSQCELCIFTILRRDIRNFTADITNSISVNLQLTFECLRLLIFTMPLWISAVWTERLRYPIPHLATPAK